MDLLAGAATSAAAAIGGLSGPRVTCYVTGHGARPEGVDQIVILGLLACRQLKAEYALILSGDLSVLSGQLLLCELVQQGASVAVLIVDYIPCRRLDGVAGIARLCGDIIIDISDGSSCLAAALGLICAHGIEHLHQGGLLVTAGQFGLSKALLCCGAGGVNAVVEGKGAVTNALLDTAHAVFQLAEVHVLAQVGPCQRAGTTAKSAEAITAPATEGEKEQDDYPPCAIVPITVVTVVVSRYSGDIGRGHFRGCQTHFRSPLIDFLYKCGHIYHYLSNDLNMLAA